MLKTSMESWRFTRVTLASVSIILLGQTGGRIDQQDDANGRVPKLLNQGNRDCVNGTHSYVVILSLRAPGLSVASIYQNVNRGARRLAEKS